ncbi:hypothetical protein Q8A73_011394 [Channa argus]|nr:hypothetical protein Q8A73_011394 [Channa argus]
MFAALTRKPLIFSLRLLSHLAAFGARAGPRPLTCYRSLYPGDTSAYDDTRLWTVVALHSRDCPSSALLATKQPNLRQLWLTRELVEEWGGREP